MPHCIIEYSKDLRGKSSIQELVDEVFEATKSSELFNPEDIKVRAKAYKYYKITDTASSFIHIEIKLIEGRSVEQKQALVERVQKAVAALNIKSVVLSIEINDLEKATYYKD